MQAGIPANFVGSLKVGSATRVAVYAGTGFTGASCTYNAGAAPSTICLGINQLSALAVANDSAPPSMSVTHTIGGQNGWNVASPVTLAITASDASSGLLGAPTCKDNATSITVSGSAPSYSTNVTGGGTHTVVCTVRDRLGNVTNATDTVRIDGTAPHAHPHWYESRGSVRRGTWTSDDVAVSFVCTDAGSGVASVSPPVTFSAEGAGQATSGTCIDNAGNTTTRALDPIAIDKTPPVIAGSRGPSRIRAVGSRAMSSSASAVTTRCRASAV